ncbi:MAG: hypothetical protein NC820_02555 [Candidatus Omnitrophica bacterium]|nr:hypothetical protein [Candidatus Omnitrophota bacterium]
MKGLSVFHIKLLGVIICVCYTLFFGFFVINSSLRCKSIANKVREEENFLNDFKDEIKNFEETIDKLRKEKEEFSQYLFSDKDIASFLEKISTFAKESKVNIINMQTKNFEKVEEIDKEGVLSPLAKAKLSAKKGSSKEVGNLKEKDKIKASSQEITGPVLSFLPIDMKVEGTFQDLVNFLIYLEKYRQLITLPEIEIRVNKYPLLSCSFLLNIYSLRDLEEIRRK